MSDIPYKFSEKPLGNLITISSDYLEMWNSIIIFVTSLHRFGTYWMPHHKLSCKNICEFFENLSRKLKNLCILKGMPLILHKARYAFITISLLFYKKWETFKMNILSKTKKPNSVVNHFWQHFSMCNNTKNTTDETSHMRKYNTVQACSVLETSSTNTHSEY